MKAFSVVLLALLIGCGSESVSFNDSSVAHDSASSARDADPDSAVGQDLSKDIASAPDQPTHPPGVQLSVTAAGTGTILSQPAGIQCPSSCQHEFPAGTPVTLTAQPAVGWRFKGWSGDCAGDGPCHLTLDAPRTATATFELLDPRWDPAVGVDDCAAAWGTAGEGLSPCDTTPDDYVVVRKSKRNLALCAKGANTANYRIALGTVPIGDKEQSGDKKTPEGVFYIPRLVPGSTYYKAFLVSYPDKEDADRGLKAGLISASEKATIDAAQDSCTEPPSSTTLGGLIEIHGWGMTFVDWTAGCVAIEDAEMDLLWAVISTHDTIIILP